MGFPIRRMFVVSVSLFYIYMGVCTVSPILNSSLHSELVSIVSSIVRNVLFYLILTYSALGFAYFISLISVKHTFQTYFDGLITINLLIFRKVPSTDMPKYFPEDSV